jgi:hydroxymethylglutaryl-CoA lyase
MSTTKDLIKMIYDKPINCNKMVLVPNYEKFKEINLNAINTISLITSCSESFTLKNTKMTIDQSLDEIQKIVETVKYLDKVKLRIYISCSFGCPIENTFSKIYINRIMNIFSRFVRYNCVKEIVISDTNGSFDYELFEDYLCFFGNFANYNKLSFHIHKHDPTLEWACNIVNKTLNKTVSLDCSMGEFGGCSSLAKMPPNLPTVLMARAYNIVSKEAKYDIAHLDQLDKIFTSNLEIF